MSEHDGEVLGLIPTIISQAPSDLNCLVSAFYETQFNAENCDLVLLAGVVRDVFMLVLSPLYTRQHNYM